MTLDELTTRFDLARQSVASWSNDLIAIIRATGEARETGRPQPDVIDVARRTLATVEAERQDLADAAATTPDISHELAAGVETSLAEMDSLRRELLAAINQLEATPGDTRTSSANSAGTLPL